MSADQVVAELYQKYAGMVLRRIRRFYRGDEAEEVLHEVFIVVLEKIDTFRGQASPTTWLYRVATNHCLNRLRNEGRRRELWEEHGEVWGPSQSSAPQETTTFLRQLWQSLPQELITIGVYYHVDGLTHAEIARITGVSRRTVGNRLAELETLAREAAASAPGDETES